MPRYYYPQERVSILPLGVVDRSPKSKLDPQPLKEYQTQIPGCTEIAGCAVKDKKVKLTKEQAQYWLDQGAIGEGAGEHHAGAALGLKKTKK